MRLVFVQEAVYFLKCRQKVLQIGFYLFFVFFLQTFFQEFVANKEFSDCKGKFLHKEIVA